MSDDPLEVRIHRDADEHRWQAYVGGELAGFSRYRLTADHVVFDHTEVEDRFAGRGVAGTIIRRALDDVAAEGTRRVVALCPYVKAWIERHPDYQHLADEPPPQSETPEA